MCTHLLLNLSDDGKVEQKMANRGIVPLLCRMLAMKSGTALPSLVCAFAAKLAMFRENKDEMVGFCIASLMRYVSRAGEKRHHRARRQIARCASFTVR